MNIAKKYKQVLIILLLLSNKIMAGEINSLDIAYETAKGYTEYMHYKWIGICTWINKRSWPKPPSFYVSNEVDYFAPDLVITVFNKVGDNPWSEADFLDKASHKGIKEIVKKKYGIDLGNTDIRDSYYRQSATAIKRKIVDVIGHPNTLLGFPLAGTFMLTPDTTSFFPYYQSELDVFNTIGAIEGMTRPLDTMSVISGKIGRQDNYWGFMFPREMSAIINNDYKASLVFAARAAHIVTNRNEGHVVKSTANSCGVNCRVSSVQYEQKEKMIKWQEIYPNNRHIKLGEVDYSLNPMSSMGNKEYQDGEGNYVFVIWRRYQGCVQPPPHYKLYSKTKKFDPTVRA